MSRQDSPSADAEEFSEDDSFDDFLDASGDEYEQEDDTESPLSIPLPFKFSEFATRINPNYVQAKRSYEDLLTQIALEQSADSDEPLADKKKNQRKPLTEEEILTKLNFIYQFSLAPSSGKSAETTKLLTEINSLLQQAFTQPCLHVPMIIVKLRSFRDTEFKIHLPSPNGHFRKKKAVTNQLNYKELFRALDYYESDDQKAIAETDYPSQFSFLPEISQLMRELELNKHVSKRANSMCILRRYFRVLFMQEYIEESLQSDEGRQAYQTKEQKLERWQAYSTCITDLRSYLSLSKDNKERYVTFIAKLLGTAIVREAIFLLFEHNEQRDASAKTSGADPMAITSLMNQLLETLTKATKRSSLVVPPPPPSRVGRPQLDIPSRAMSTTKSNEGERPKSAKEPRQRLSSQEGNATLFAGRDSTSPENAAKRATPTAHLKGKAKTGFRPASANSQ